MSPERLAEVSASLLARGLGWRIGSRLIHEPTHDLQRRERRRNPPLPSLHTTDAAIVAEELSQRGIRFQQWPTHGELDATSSQEEILAAYSAEIAQVQADGGYQTVDAISLGPDHPQRAELRQKFLSEHTHSEDEVRFFVDGKGLFCLHIGDEVLQVLCERNDWLSVPAGTRHWFDMGERPCFSAIRFFNNKRGGSRNSQAIQSLSATPY